MLCVDNMLYMQFFTNALLDCSNLEATLVNMESESSECYTELLKLSNIQWLISFFIGRLAHFTSFYWIRSAQ
jgi:hypothetical protein